MHGDTDGTLRSSTLPARRARVQGPLHHARRGRGLAQPARPRRRGRRGAPEDLRGAALLRAARRRADRRRGHRHRRPDLRDLPDRVPDDGGPRVRGPVRDRDRPVVRALRRLLYCGEWIQSHALHVYLLHAPDFLGYPSALAMAADHRAVVEQGLAIKKVGNAADRRPGRPARSIPSPSGSAASPGCRGGRDLDAVRRALDERRGVVAGDRPARRHVGPARVRASAAAGRPAPPRRVPLQRRPDRLDGRRWTWRPGAWRDAFEEHHVEGTQRAPRPDPGRGGLPPRAHRADRAGPRTRSTRSPPRRSRRPASRTRSAQHPSLDRRARRRAAPRVRRGARPHRRVPPAARAARPVHAAAGRRRLVHRGAARPPPPPLRGGRAGARRARPDRPARPARTREPSRPTSRRSPRASSTSPMPRRRTASRC